MEAGEIVALVPDAAEAEATRTDLSVHGIHAEVVAPQPGTYEDQDESFHEEVHGGGRGLVRGAVIGGVVGLVVALAVPVIRDLGPIAIVLMTLGFAYGGTLPGIVWGVGRADHYDDDPAVTRDLEAEDHLVIVHEVHDRERAHAIMERHDVTFLTDDHPLHPAA